MEVSGIVRVLLLEVSGVFNGRVFWEGFRDYKVLLRRNCLWVFRGFNSNLVVVG